MGKWLAQVEKSLKGKTAVVTGGARGIGREIATAFATEGVNIAILDVLEEEGKKTAQNLEGLGVKPDILVKETIDDRLNDRDPQLKKAIEVIKDLIAGKKPELDKDKKPVKMEPKGKEESKDEEEGF